MFMLMEQKDTITRSIASEKAMITNIESSIERLEEVAQSIENDQQTIETTKVEISDIVIDPSVWRGSKQRTYKEEMETYTEDIQSVSQYTEYIRGTIKAELQRRRDQLLTAQNTLISLETSLTSVNSEIQQQRRSNNG